MAFKCLGCALREGSCGTAAGSWQAVCATCSTTPIHIPCDRVRLCPESLGKWSARRAPFMLWDTGAGAVVSARKFYLSPTPDGNVAIVFRSVAEARVVDGLLGGSVIKPNRPLPLRFCSGSKSFCSGICFGSATDTCCLAHQRPQPPVDIPEPSAKRQRAAETESVLCAFLGDEEEEDDALSFESLRELCNVHEGAEGASDDALPAGSRQPSPVHSDSSRSTVSAPSSPHAEKTWPSSSLFGWSDGVWEPAAADEGDDLFSNLEVLLCEAPCGSASMAVDLDSLSAANYAALACLPSPPAASAPLPPHLSMPSDLLPRGLSLEPARPSAAPCPPRGASPASLKPALPRVKHAARWRPCTDLGPAKPRAPSAVAPSAAPDAKPVAEPGAKPAGKPKNIKSRAIWKSAIVL